MCNNKKERMDNLPRVDRVTRKRMLTEMEQTRQQKDAEASRLMGQLGLMVEKTISLGDHLIRIRRKRDSKPIWNRRGKNPDKLLNELLKWLRQKAERRRSGHGEAEKE